MQHHMILGACKGGNAEPVCEKPIAQRFLICSGGQNSRGHQNELQGITGRRLCGRKILVAVHILEAIMSFESKLISLVSFRK